MLFNVRYKQTNSILPGIWDVCRCNLVHMFKEEFQKIIINNIVGSICAIFIWIG